MAAGGKKLAGGQNGKRSAVRRFGGSAGVRNLAKGGGRGSDGSRVRRDRDSRKPGPACVLFSSKFGELAGIGARRVILGSIRTRLELVAPAEVHEALKPADGAPRASQKFRLRRAVLSAYIPAHGAITGSPAGSPTGDDPPRPARPAGDRLH